MSTYIAVYETPSGDVVPFMKTDQLMASWPTLDAAKKDVEPMLAAQAYCVSYLNLDSCE